jgi:AcrR family transcriptional regulator
MVPPRLRDIVIMMRVNSHVKGATTLTPTRRDHQKQRTRAAVLAAARELVLERQPPSVPAAAERARVSPATAYRYFPQADQLWEEASLEAFELAIAGADAEERIKAAGDDVEARLDALITSIGWRMIDDPGPYHVLARAGIDRWFEQQGRPDDEPVPVRQGRRTQYNALVIEPLRAELPEEERAQLQAALGLVWGPEAVISLVDVMGLDADLAKQTMLRTAHWILRSALAEPNCPTAARTDAQPVGTARTKANRRPP